MKAVPLVGHRSGGMRGSIYVHRLSARFSFPCPHHGVRRSAGLFGLKVDADDGFSVDTPETSVGAAVVSTELA